MIIYTNYILTMRDKRAKFMRIFANIPPKVRKEDIIVVVDDQPFTWNAAMIEVKNNTKTGETIIEKLTKLKII